MKVKIISDGTPRGTKVVNVETGEIVENVTRIFWDIGIDRLATAHIEVLKCEVDIEIEKDLTKIKYKGVNKMRVQMYKGTAYNPVEEVDRTLAMKDEKIAELEEKLKAKSDKKKEEPKKGKNTSKMPTSPLISP